MDRYESELQIRNRYAAYCFAVDDRDPDAMAECFAEDAVVDVAGRGVLRGRQAIADVQRTPSTNRHLVANLWLRSLESDSARADAYFLVLNHEGQSIGHGRYEDELSLDADGIWRFRKRVITFVWQAPVYDALVSRLVD